MHLRSAFDLTDADAVELLHVVRHAAPFAAAASQFAEIAVAPRVDYVEATFQ
jgi:hypothetical protein